MTGDIEAAVRALRAGELVAFPTETVYGLGADAANPDAVARLYRVKGRPDGHPVIVHVAAGADIERWVVALPGYARALGDACWPGPLTLVLPRRAGAVADQVTGGRPTVGIRVPAQPLAQELLLAFGGGVAAPSANRFGRVSPTTAAHVRADLGDDVRVVLDGGPSTVGVESTIVDCTGARPVILRHGGIGAADVARITGMAPGEQTDGTTAAPGTLPSHYAPVARVQLVERGAIAARATSSLASGARVGLLALASDVPSGLPGGLVVLDTPADAHEYGRVLYERLREADARDLTVLLAVPPTGEGIAVAVADRLRRAAAPRL
ncbi:MAG: Sua5/YciO/YrdC/YwlC family protein [Actinomycetia bacterium]|nr:Sua5/YciO/YrdC/YwlC family protein [Actinomycetes bacterium]